MSAVGSYCVQEMFRDRSSKLKQKNIPSKRRQRFSHQHAFMAPAIQSQLPLRLIQSTSQAFIASTHACNKIQRRHESIVGALHDVRSSYNKRIRVGRGPSSGYGKTSGRGHKGQKQHGKVPAGFQGGQTTAEQHAGKRGFVNM